MAMWCRVIQAEGEVWMDSSSFNPANSSHKTPTQNWHLCDETHASFDKEANERQQQRSSMQQQNRSRRESERNRAPLTFTFTHQNELSNFSNIGAIFKVNFSKFSTLEQFSKVDFLTFPLCHATGMAIAVPGELRGLELLHD